jgi:hypothetical protein
MGDEATIIVDVTKESVTYRLETSLSNHYLQNSSSDNLMTLEEIKAYDVSNCKIELNLSQGLYTINDTIGHFNLASIIEIRNIEGETVISMDGIEHFFVCQNCIFSPI